VKTHQYTEDMDDMLLFMRYKGFDTAECAYYMSREFDTFITRNSIIGRLFRLKNKNKKYKFKREDFQ